MYNKNFLDECKSIPHYNSLAQALVSLFGTSVAISDTERLSGGDINKAYKLTLNNKKCIFMKANAKQNVSFFKAEAEGLCAIASTNTIGTPKVLCTGTDDGEDVGYSFLLLDYIESAKPKKDCWEIFARELAALHNAKTEDFTNQGKFGFIHDNFIGASVQKNVAETSSASWISFFRDFRLVPQFKNADSYFTSKDRTLITRLLDHLDKFLLEPEKPSLIHGDLWKGNVLCNQEGKLILIDPACHVAHAEADIAMTELFGGFPDAFYESYKETAPFQPGYESRRDLYNLYHLLNHLNLFGPTYLEPVKSIISEYTE